MVKNGFTSKEAMQNMTARLLIAGCADADFDAGELFLFVTGIPHSLFTGKLNNTQAQMLENVVQRRVNREPLQYILGEWDFLNFTLKVGEGVLCPRADTEIVTETAANFLKQQNIATPKILELCSGSGCIALGIKMFCPNAEITAVEKSEKAFVYLEQNAKHALDTLGRTGPYINPINADLFLYYNTLHADTFDLLIANPPYLTESEMLDIEPEVAKEPAMALVAGADGLDFYRAIAKYYKNAVKQGGNIVLEIGWEQAKAVSKILISEGWRDVTCIKDYANNDRCICAIK